MANSASSVICEHYQLQCYGFSLLFKAVCMFMCKSFKIRGYRFIFRPHHSAVTDRVAWFVGLSVGSS